MGAFPGLVGFDRSVGFSEKIGKKKTRRVYHGRGDLGGWVVLSGRDAETVAEAHLHDCDGLDEAAVADV